MLSKQYGFWNDAYIGNIRKKLEELCRNNPSLIESERLLILEYWRTFDNLNLILGDKISSFTSWFNKATLPETLSRCLRSLKEEGIIKEETHESTSQLSSSFTGRPTMQKEAVKHGR